MKLPQGLTRSIGRNMLQAKKGAPTAFFVVGVIGSIASTVLACRATLKLPDRLDDFKADLDAVKTQYPEDQHKKEYARAYAINTGRIVKLYAPSVVIGVASIGALTGSHVAMHRRNAALASAYSGLSVAFEEYRDRVKEKLGEEGERDIYLAATTEKVAIDGKMKELKRVDPGHWSPYARVFDEFNINWHNDALYNKTFLTGIQQYYDSLLKSRGHVFLNEVYDHLGFPRTQAGQVVGWVMDNGDNFVDFGLWEATTTRFMNGFETSIILDFNVDGVIYHLIG